MDLHRKVRQDENGSRRSHARKSKRNNLAAPAPRPAHPLSRQRIELVALELIVVDGLPAFSQRALARSLGIRGDVALPLVPEPARSPQRHPRPGGEQGPNVSRQNNVLLTTRSRMALRRSSWLGYQW